ncbi:MAG: DUF6449 domain-containing protein [Clostridia bacterium]|nr:DUF6449 domain-containing protein [Clostridia bacterium]
MTQKNSSCKLGTMIGKCCERNAALFTLSMLLQLVAMPVYLIMEIQAMLRYGDVNIPESRNTIVASIRDMLLAGSIETLALLLLAVLSGIAMFRYLHVKQQTDFFHALPVTRGKLFASRVLSGILAVIPAYLINVLLSCGVCIVYGFSDAIQIDILLLSVVVHVAAFLLVYAVSILAAIVSGHTLVSLLVCGWFQMGLLAGYEAVNQLLYVLYPARVNNSNMIPLWMSPIVKAFCTVETLREGWADIDKNILYFKECAPGLLFCLIAAIIILALAYWLNKIRKSEHTGLSIAFPKIELPFKLYMVSVLSIACGLAFQITITSWTALFLAMAIGALVAACIVEIVYDLDFHSLFHRWKSLLAYYVVCAVVLGCMAMDITHWNSTLPERDEIASATLSTGPSPWNCSPTDGDLDYYYDYYYYYGHDLVYNAFSWISGVWSDSSIIEDEELAIDHISNSQMESAAALDVIYDSASMGAERMKHNRSTLTSDVEYSTYRVTFTLQNGKTFQRQYYMPEDTAELSENAANARFSEEYLEKYTAAALAHTSKEQVAELLVANYTDIATGNADVIDNAKAVSDILDTLYEESQELTKEYVTDNIPVLAVRVAGKQAVEEWDKKDLADLEMTGGMEDDIIDIPVYSCETETLELLGKYIEDFSVGFMPEKVVCINVTTYTDDGDEETETFRTDEIEDVKVIQKWVPYLLPEQLKRMIDPVYFKPEENGLYIGPYAEIAVTLADGTEVTCYCYRDVDGKE